MNELLANALCTLEYAVDNVMFTQLTAELLPKFAMPTRSDETGSELKAASFASVWSNTRLVGLSVLELVQSELVYAHV